MWDEIKAAIERIKTWFEHSETILWSRLQVAVGIIWTVLSVADLSPLLSAKYLTYWLVVNGIISEYLRRRGTEVRNGFIRSVDTIDK